jgi:hypothetical protein
VFNQFKFISIALLTALLCGCGGGGGGSAAAPATETSSSQLAGSVKLTGYAGLSLAQAKVANGTQTAYLHKLFDWVTDAVFPKAYAQAAAQCNYDLLKLAGVASDGTLEKLAVTTGADDCTTGFIDMYDGAKYILLTASGIYKDGLTCNLVLINKGDGNLYCVGERSRSIYKISGADSWKAYEKLQVSDDGNYMFLETDSTVFDQNGQVTGIKTKLLRFDLTDSKVGPVASTLVEGVQQTWLNNTFGYNTDTEGFSIKGYQGLNNGDVAILYQRYISTAGTWAQKLNAFYYVFKTDGTYDRVKFDDTAINTSLTQAYQAATSNNPGWGGQTQMQWYDISCFFKDSADDNAFIFTIPYYYGYMLPNSSWQSGVQAVIFKGSRPAAGATTMSVSTVRGDSAICSESSSMGAGMTTSGGGSRPSKVGDTYYALQTSSGWDSGTNQWLQKTYLVSNKFDASADVKKLVSNSNTWMGSRKLYATKDYLFLKSPSTGTAWTMNSQPGDNLWRIDPRASFHALTAQGELNPLDYMVAIDASEFISIAKLATTSTDNKAKLTGRNLNDPDLAKIIGDIDEDGLFTKAAAANKDLQPISIVKL